MKQAKRNRMIPRFCYRHEELEGSFVTDLDTTRSPSRDLTRDSGSDSDTGDASRPSKRHNPAVSAQEAVGRTGGTLLRAVGSGVRSLVVSDHAATWVDLEPVARRG